MAKNNIKKTGGLSSETQPPFTDGNNIRPFKKANNLKKSFKEGYG